MSFTNPKPGGYLTGEKLPSAHVNTVWANVAKAIDGSAGGAYTLSSGISLTGTNTLALVGIFSSYGQTDFGFGLITFTDCTVNHANETCDYDLACTVTYNGAVVFSNTSTTAIDGAVTYSSGSLETHSAGAIDTYAAGSQLNLNGPVSLTGVVSRTGGYINDRVIDGADANTTYSPTQGDLIFVDSSTLSAPRNYTLTKTGINVGARMRIINFDTDAITVKDEGGSTVAVVRTGAGAGQYLTWVDVVRLGGSADTWFVCGGQIV